MSLMSLIVRMNLDKTGFDAGLNAAGKKIASFGSDIKSQLAGAFGVAAMTQFAKSAIETAGNIADVADRLGVTTDQAQQLALAAKTSGGDIETVASKLELMRKAMDAAVASGKVGPFEKLGLSIADLQRMDPVDVLERMTSQLEAQGVAGKAASAAFELFGKGGGKMITMMQDFAKAKENAALISPADIRAAQAFDDAWTTAIANAKSALVTFMADAMNSKNNPLDPSSWSSTRAVGRMLGFEMPGDREQANQETEDETRMAAMKKQLDDRARLVGLAQQEEAMIMRIVAANEKNRNAGLSPEEKVTEAKAKLEMLKAELDAANAAGRGGAAAALAIVEQEGILAALTRGLPKAGDDMKPAAFKPSTDSLGRIGGTVGGSGVQDMPTTQRQMLAEIKSLKNAMLVRGIKLQDIN